MGSAKPVRTPVLIRMMSAWPQGQLLMIRGMQVKKILLLSCWEQPVLMSCTHDAESLHLIVPGFVTGVLGYVPPLSPPPGCVNPITGEGN